MAKQDPIVMENWDGRKAYLGTDRFSVRKLGNTRYLFPDLYRHSSETPEVYRPVRTPKSLKELDCTRAVKVDDKSIIAKLIEIPFK